MNHVGKTLKRELNGTEVDVVYGIDKNADRIYSDIKITSDIVSEYEVDAVIVTAISSYNEIKKELQKKITIPIVSLDSVLDDVM